MVFNNKVKHWLIMFLVMLSTFLGANYIVKTDEQRCAKLCHENGQAYIYKEPRNGGTLKMGNTDLSKPSSCECVIEP
jgi:hypothetical protein